MKWDRLSLVMLVAGSVAAPARAQESPRDPAAASSEVSREGESKGAEKSASEHLTKSQSHGKAARPGNALGLPLLKNIALDQRAIWTSPSRIRFEDATWLVPLGGLTAGLLATDSGTSRHLSNAPNRINHSRSISNYGVASLVGAAGGLYLWGKATQDEHKRETGFLAGEALLNGLAVNTAIQLAAGRERPSQDFGRGRFGQNGRSFPPNHAMAAWSVASVIAHEYPGPLTKLLAYGLASAVSVSRVTAKEHFPSDVLVGSAIGWFVGQRVYRAHHHPDLGGGSWETPSEMVEVETRRQPGNMGSPYVPLDSWVYPALERLSAQGYAPTAFLGLRPWTRLECARLVNEAEDRLRDEESEQPEVSRLYRTLKEEFSGELDMLGGGSNRRLRLESIYTRFTGIEGEPLRDGYHFGQTLINDYGRPFAEGFNAFTGFSAWATAGHFATYVRGEYQHAPSAPALPEGARQFIAAADGLPSAPPSTPFSDVNRFRLLDAYAAMNLENWQVSFGKQSLWWGPGQGGPMMFSDNVEPINMFRINRISPLQLPSILKFLGPVRMEFFIGQLDGHHFARGPAGVTGSWSQLLNRQPFTDGEKFSFRPSTNLEIGFTYATIFAGSGIPATLHTFFQSLLDKGETPSGLSNSGRRSGLDFTYRIPKLRKWLTLYGDGFAQDQITFFIDPKGRPLPFGYPERAVWRAGIYVPMFPRLPKLDFRAEGVYTDNPDPGIEGLYNHGYYYRAGRYLNGYTNNSNLLGSWIGRQGQGVQTWTNYWFNARDRIQLNFRHQKVSQEFIPGGGTLTDVGVRGDYWLGFAGISAWVQHERWLFPVIQPNVSRNVTVTVQVSFEPQKLFTHSIKDAKGTTSGLGNRP